MKFLPLIFANLGRRKIRTVLTLGSVFVAFLLFGLLMAVKAGFGVGVELTGADRLVTKHKTSLILPLPESYGREIAQIDGVADVAHANWFGGIYQDPKNFFPSFAIQPEAYLRIYPEIELTEAEKEAFLANRQGAIVGRATAERYGFEVGDRIPLRSPIYGNQTYEFVIEGIYDAAPGFDDSNLMFHYEYLAESLPQADGQVGWYVVEIADPDRAEQIAERVDAQFANSPAETETSTEKAFVQSFANQTGNIVAIVTSILAVVFFTLLLVAGNTAMQAVRERTGELAVMKTLGFSDARVMRLVLAESLLVAALGGLPALALVTVVINGGFFDSQFLPTLVLPTRSVVLGVALIAGLGLVVGAVPAWRALRLDIVNALRRRA